MNLHIRSFLVVSAQEVHSGQGELIRDATPEPGVVADELILVTKPVGHVEQDAVLELTCLEYSGVSKCL